jgi:hypothetical protein
VNRKFYYFQHVRGNTPSDNAKIKLKRSRKKYLEKEIGCMEMG